MKKIFEGYAFDTSTNPPVFCHHEMRTDSQTFEHLTDGILRTSGTIENMADYLRSENVRHIGTDSETLQAARKIHTPKPVAFPVKRGKKK